MCKLSLCSVGAVAAAVAVVLLSCLAVEVHAGAVGAAPVPVENLRNITVVKDVRTLIHKHPLKRLLRVQTQVQGLQTVRYTLGGELSAQRLVAQAADVFKYPARKDVSIQLTYPQEGTGAIINYVDISCTQDNTAGNAYVVAGGIGQRFISIVLEASQTVNFSYQAQYYGTD